MTLSRVESAFRALKSDLGFRPTRQHGELRTQGHLFGSVLAYPLLASIERSFHPQGDPRIWATLHEQLATHPRSTISLRGEGNPLHQIRISGNPEPVHQKIYRLLNIQDLLPRNRRDLVL